MISLNAPLEELAARLGDGKIVTDPLALNRLLHDQSWLSPVWQDQASSRRSQPDAAGEVAAAAVPTTMDELIDFAAWAARHRVPITVRGAATSNFGLLNADHGGVVLDLRALRSQPSVDAEHAFTALAGTTHGSFEQVARSVGREMPVLTTTFPTATIGGWLAGGHVGLGSGCHGAVWDGLIRSVRLVTVEEQPRVLTLSGSAVEPVLHTFGAGGLIAEVTLESTPSHVWMEVVACFPAYAQAAEFTARLSLDSTYRHRAAAAQDVRLTPGLETSVGNGRHGSLVLMVIDDSQFDAIDRLAKEHGGVADRWQPWTPGVQGLPSIARMVYGHRMLWVKKLLPRAGFVHVYFDPNDPWAGQQALKSRFGDDILLETKFIRSPWMMRTLGFEGASRALAASVVTVVDGTPQRIHEVLAACADLGLKAQNSHTNIVEDNGLFPDVSSLVKHKLRVDPYNLVNRGRLRSAEERA